MNKPENHCTCGLPEGGGLRLDVVCPVHDGQQREGYEQNEYVGKFNLDIKKLYLAYRIARYLYEHPGAKLEKASKYARVAWRRKASDHKRK